MRQTPDPVRLRIILDAEGGACLWAGNERTKAQYGYAVMANSLPNCANPVWAFNRLSARLLGVPEMTIKAIGLAATPATIQDALSIYS